jgi:predicted amidohydrolase
MIFLTRLKTQPPVEGAGIRFAIYQGERPVGTPAALQDNLAKLGEIVREAKKYDVQLIFGKEHLGGHTWHYRGNSMLCGPHGDMILAARPEETLLIADIVPGDYGPTHPEGHYLKNRRPEPYKQLVAMQAACEGGYAYRIPPE